MTNVQFHSVSTSSASIKRWTNFQLGCAQKYLLYERSRAYFLLQKVTTIPGVTWRASGVEQVYLKKLLAVS